MSVCCECCVLSGRGLCDELITRPEESYRLWCVVVCDVETSRMRRPWPALGRSATGEKNRVTEISLSILQVRRKLYTYFKKASDGLKIVWGIVAVERFNVERQYTVL